MKKIWKHLMLCIFLLAACTVTVSANQDKIRDSCVRIGVKYDEKSEDFDATGSGFAVGKPGKPVRYFVTNRHVVKDAKKVYIVFDNENDMVLCDIKAISSKADLAILSITFSSLSYFTSTLYLSPAGAV